MNSDPIFHSPNSLALDEITLDYNNKLTEAHFIYKLCECVHAYSGICADLYTDII